VVNLRRVAFRVGIPTWGIGAPRRGFAKEEKIMLFIRTKLVRTALVAGMLATMGASGSAGARVGIEPIRVCCAWMLCFPCVDGAAAAEAIPGVLPGQTPLAPPLALAEDRCGKQTEAPDEDFAGIPYARS